MFIGGVLGRIYWLEYACIVIWHRASNFQASTLMLVYTTASVMGKYSWLEHVFCVNCCCYVKGNAGFKLESSMPN